LDLLEKEKVLKESREKAIEFLENLTRNTDSKKESEQIEKRIISILQTQQNTLEQMDEHLSQLKAKSSELEEEIKMKTVEFERAEKRLESMNNAKPAHFNEMRQMEAELSHVYRIYVEKIRNHDFLSSQLEKYHIMDEERNKNIDKELKVMKENMQKIDVRNLYDENEELNGDENDDYYDNYQKDAMSKNVIFLLIFVEF
jgi:clusterin-associated protein 1